MSILKLKIPRSLHHLHFFVPTFDLIRLFFRKFSAKKKGFATLPFSLEIEQSSELRSEVAKYVREPSEVSSSSKSVYYRKFYSKIQSERSWRRKSWHKSFSSLWFDSSLQHYLPLIIFNNNIQNHTSSIYWSFPSYHIQQINYFVVPISRTNGLNFEWMMRFHVSIRGDPTPILSMNKRIF